MNDTVYIEINWVIDSAMDWVISWAIEIAST
jgi:hypothetical protein